MPTLKEYHKPTEVSAALALLRRKSPHTVPLAGGTWLTPRLGKEVQAGAVVDLSPLGLDGIERDPDTLRLGPMATLAEIRTAQYEAGRLVDELGLSVASGTNIQENRVELFVTDRPLFDATLQAAGVQLPDLVEVITIYEPLGDDIPFAVTPCPTIQFPQLKTRSAAFMAALLEGELVVKDGCLRVGLGDGGESHLVIWQPDHFLNNNEGVIEIWDRNGEAVARVGEEIRMGGGEVRMTEEMARQLREPLPDECEGPYWLMGELAADD